MVVMVTLCGSGVNREDDGWLVAVSIAERYQTKPVRDLANSACFNPESKFPTSDKTQKCDNLSCVLCQGHCGHLSDQGPPP